ncbi:chromosomal replication initiator protein DnaA [Lachnospiraceae bacterium]|nr:chromosomal replication initiator protein DnaA [Lachnospiraceae bacterium]
MKINENYTFTNYVVGETNSFTVEAAKMFANTVGDNSPLFIYGEAGVGKTHLVNAVANAIHEKNLNIKIEYVTAENFANEVIDCIRSGNSEMKKMRMKYRDADVFICDNIEFVQSLQSTQSELFYIIEDLTLMGKKVLITSYLPPAKLFEDCGKFRALIETCCLAEIRRPDKPLINDILDFQIKKMSIPLGEEIKNCIADGCERDVCKLLGVLNTIQMHMKIKKTCPDLENIQKMLEDL